MKKVHLRINYGADDRFNIVRNTLTCSHKYFETIRLVNLGPDDNSDKFAGLTTKFSNLTISNYGRYYHMCETEDLFRSHYSDIPDGDWAIWLDSDWRLPDYFLKNMHKEIDICESEGFTHIFSYQLAHHLGDSHIANEYCAKSSGYTQHDLDQSFLRMREDPGRYGWPLLQKMDKASEWCDSFLGNHPYIIHMPYKIKRVPEMYHLHFRDYSDKAYCGGSLFLCWWYLGHHVFSIEEQLEIQHSWEFDAFEAFKKKHSCFTSTQLHTKIKANDIAFVEELKQLCLKFKDSTIYSCKQLFRLADQYNMQFYKAPDEYKCDGVCCQYDGKNILEL